MCSVNSTGLQLRSRFSGRKCSSTPRNAGGRAHLHDAENFTRTSRRGWSPPSQLVGLPAGEGWLLYIASQVRIARLAGERPLREPCHSGSPAILAWELRRRDPRLAGSGPTCGSESSASRLRPSGQGQEAGRPCRAAKAYRCSAKGAAALLRQQGAGHTAPSPAAGAKKGAKKEEKKEPRQRYTRAAVIDDIALPRCGSEPVLPADAQDTAGGYLRQFKTLVLKDPEEIRTLKEEMRMSGEKAYVHPNIEKNMLSLVTRLARAGMLMAIPLVESEIGLFTVAKKVIPETGRIMLRLAFDRRAPNKFWRDPPWTPLVGPGAFAAIDLDQVQGEGEEAWLAMASGDLPDCFFHWGIEEELAAWFAVLEITVGDLEKTLAEEGDHEVLARLRRGAAGDPTKRLGLRVLPMGWSRSVCLAQAGLQDIVKDVWGASGPPFFEHSAVLVEGGPPPVLELGRLFHVEYIDDFGIMVPIIARTEIFGRELLHEALDVVIKELARFGFEVHKIVVGDQSNCLGVDLGGRPPRAQPDAAKQWLAAEAMWEIARCTRALPSAVESVVALATWLFMLDRGGLSAFQQVYAWCREH